MTTASVELRGAIGVAGSTTHVAATLLYTRRHSVYLEYGWVKYYSLDEALRRLRNLHLISVDRSADAIGDDYRGLDGEAARHEFVRALGYVLGDFAATGRRGQVDILNGLLDFVDGVGGFDGLESLAFSGLAAAAGINARDAFGRGLGALNKHGLPDRLGGGEGRAPIFGPDGFHLGGASYGDLADIMGGLGGFADDLLGLAGLPADLTGLLPGGKAQLPAIGRPGQEVGLTENEYVYGGALVGGLVGAAITKSTGGFGVGAVVGGLVGAVAWDLTHDAPEPHADHGGYTKDGADAAVFRAEAAKSDAEAAQKHNEAQAYLAEAAKLETAAEKKQKEADEADKKGETEEAEKKQAEADQSKKDAEDKRKEADEAERSAQDKEKDAEEKRKKAEGKGSQPVGDGDSGGQPHPEWLIPASDGGLWVLSPTCPTGPGVPSLIEHIGDGLVSVAQIPSFSWGNSQVRLERAGVLARNPGLAATLFMPHDNIGSGTQDSLPADDGGGPVQPNTLPDDDGSEPTPTSLPLLVEATLTVGARAATAGLSQNRLRGVQDAIETRSVVGIAQNIANSVPGLSVADALAGLDILRAHVETITGRA